MSSDFLWRPTDVSRFAFIYAGAQKNLGPSGVTVVIVRKDFMAKGRKDLPKILKYTTFAENNSLYNTPPTFAIYLMRNVLAWIEQQGGLTAMEKRNTAKAELLYGALDRMAGFYTAPVEKAARSTMNVVFRLPSEALEDEFVAAAKKQRMVGPQGSPERGRHPGEHLQRGQRRGREGAGLVHGETSPRRRVETDETAEACHEPKL